MFDIVPWLRPNGQIPPVQWSHYNFSRKQGALRGKLREHVYWPPGNSALGSPVSSRRTLGPRQVYLLVDEWSSWSGGRSRSGVPGMGMAWGQNFPISLFTGAHPDPRYVNYTAETQSSRSWTRAFLGGWGPKPGLGLSSGSRDSDGVCLSQPCRSWLPGSQAGQAGGSGEALPLPGSPAQGTPLCETSKHTAIFPIGKLRRKSGWHPLGTEGLAPVGSAPADVWLSKPLFLFFSF